MFANFLSARHGILPDDEALLAAQWALVDRSVFEVQGVDRDRLDLYDIARGESITVVNTQPSDWVRAGTVLIGRPLPVGDTYRSFGGFMAVPRSHVASSLDAIERGDGFEVAALIGETHAPPRMQNTDGDDLVMHTLRWRTDDPDVVDRALRAAGMQADGSGTWQLTRDAVNQQDTLIALLRLEADTLVGEVNSDRRADELQALVAVAIPGAELLDDDAKPIEQALAEHNPAEAPLLPHQNDPAMRDVMEQIIARFEAQWLDESIPALGGRTPRQAADDPIGREELEQLLASFPEPGPDSAGMMSPDRLRQALGL